MTNFRPCWKEHITQAGIGGIATLCCVAATSGHRGTLLDPPTIDTPSVDWEYALAGFIALVNLRLALLHTVG